MPPTPPPDCLQLEVLEKKECEALGMGMYLGVAEASAEPVSGACAHSFAEMRSLFH